MSMANRNLLAYRLLFNFYRLTNVLCLSGSPGRFSERDLPLVRFCQKTTKRLP